MKSQSNSLPSEIGEPIQEIAILWLTAGLGCDGDTISMTAASQPSIEDILVEGSNRSQLANGSIDWRRMRGP